MLSYGWKKIYRFFFVLVCIWGHCFQVQAPGGLYSERQFKGGFFVLRVWGAYTDLEGLIFEVLRYYDHFEAEEMHISVPRKTNINFLLTISTYHQGERLYGIIKWSPKGNCFGRLLNSLNLFLKVMYEDQSGEFVCSLRASSPIWALSEVSLVRTHEQGAEALPLACAFLLHSPK